MGGDFNIKTGEPMLQYIHLNPKFEKRLNALKKSEKMAVSAVKKAEEIINNMKNNTDAPMSILGKFAKHGEARIKNCIKYDIGKGYRLICVREKQHLFLLFIGTHDDCATWIENNRHLTPDPDNKNWITHVVKNRRAAYTDNIAESLLEDDYEDILLEKITEKDLQSIFRGLIA